MSTSPTLVILAAGMGSRYGGLKQLDAVGPNGEGVIDYSVFDARRAGFEKVVFVIRRDFEAAFKAFVDGRIGDAIAVDYVYQSLDDLPDGFEVPDGREKPWGTGHAVLAAADVVDGPFAAINADDFYGRDAYVRLAEFLRGPATTGRGRHCMVGFLLRKTLSEFGSVSRGLCDVDADGKLRSVTELTHISATADGAAENAPPDGPVRPLTGDEFVSMNMWGFSPDLFDDLRDAFVAFLRRRGGELKSECYIPSVVDSLIRDGRATVDLLPTTSEWFGVTYQQDKPHVAASIRTLIAAGQYPERLWK